MEVSVGDRGMKIPPLDEYSQPLSFRLPPEEHSFQWKSVFENVFG